MASRARLLLATSLVALPCLAFAHNGRDIGDGDEADAVEPATHERSGETLTPQGVLLDIFDGIAISVDPRTGIRSYVQVGDIPANPARAAASVHEPAIGPGADYWVEKSFAPNQGGYVSAPSGYSESSTQISSYDEGYSDYGYGYGYGYGGVYGGYLGGGYGGGRGDHGRPGHGHGGGGRPGRPDGGHDRPPINWSPPPGPPGGGVGSPPPYYSPGVGSPPPVLRYNSSFRGRRG